jgi:hypothetical protein
MLAIGLSHIAFTMLRYDCSIPSFFTAFIMKGCWSLLKVFLHLLRGSCDFCLLFCLCAVFHLLICMLKLPYILRMKSPWLWFMIFLMCCWIRIVSVLLRIFAPSIKLFLSVKWYQLCHFKHIPSLLVPPFLLGDPDLFFLGSLTLFCIKNLSKRRNSNDQKTHEKMLTISGNKGN